jgi:hypothetical protein
LALVSSRTPYVKESNNRASASASQIDVADYTNTTTAAAYPFFSKKCKVFWMIAVIAAVMSVFMTTITVVVKKQQQKKIEMKEICRDINLDDLDVDERLGPIDTDLVPAAAPVDDAAGAVPSPFAAFGQCTPGGSGCLSDGTTCQSSAIANVCDTCCSCNNSGGNPKTCTAAPTPAPNPGTTCSPNSLSCILNGVTCGNSLNQCTNPSGTVCCSCAATECSTIQGQPQFFCTATAGTTDQCPSSAPSRMVSVIKDLIDLQAIVSNNYYHLFS